MSWGGDHLLTITLLLAATTLTGPRHPRGFGGFASLFSLDAFTVRPALAIYPSIITPSLSDGPSAYSACGIRTIHSTPTFLTRFQTHGSVHGYHCASKTPRRWKVRFITTVPLEPSSSSLPYPTAESNPSGSEGPQRYDCTVTIGRDVFLVPTNRDRTKKPPSNRTILNFTGIHWKAKTLVVSIGR